MLSIIVAVAENNVIGGDNKLLWHLPADLKRFKEITTGHTIVMGRKTFESLPKVLPNRHHVIITRDKDFTVDSDDVTIVHSIDEVISKYKDSEEEVFIIGGGQIYNILYPHCQKLYLTEVFKSFNGDTYFPKINFDEYTVDYESEKLTDEKSNIAYKFINLIKK